jgi:hypothetical protein
VIAAAGHGWGLALFPLAASVVAVAFAGVLLRRFVSRRRPHEGVWALAMAMYAAASFAMFLGVARGWEKFDFRVYWLLGAVLNVPFLFMGELYLLIRRRALAHACLAALVVLAAFAASKVARAAISTPALGKTLPLGKDVFGSGSAAYRLAQYYSIPAYFLLLFGLAWSAWGMKGRPELRDRTVGTFAIAVGATLVAIGSGIGAAFNVVVLFSVSLAAGIAVMFWGFLRASARRVLPPAGDPEHSPPRLAHRGE